MASEIDWERRARELMRQHGYSAELLRNMPAIILALGREMAASARESERDELKRLGAEMADARAEEIAQAICERVAIFDKSGNVKSHAMEIARSFISKKKTREQVLEETLSQIEFETNEGDRVNDLAKRALEWKEGDA